VYVLGAPVSDELQTAGHPHTEAKKNIAVAPSSKRKISSTDYSKTPSPVGCSRLRPAPVPFDIRVAASPAPSSRVGFSNGFDSLLAYPSIGLREVIDEEDEIYLPDTASVVARRNGGALRKGAGFPYPMLAPRT
jgi:hypothetical protein